MSSHFQSISGENNNDAILYTLPTVNINSNQTVSLSGVRCLNLIAPVVVTLEISNLNIDQQVLIINTSGVNGAVVQAAAPATIGGAKQAISGTHHRRGGASRPALCYSSFGTERTSIFSKTKGGITASRNRRLFFCKKENQK